MEGIGLFDWDRPTGAGRHVFLSNDFVPRGGEEVFLGFGAFSDQGTDFTAARRPVHREFPGRAARPDDEPSDSGQYGVSLRWFLPDFAQGTEFGFFFVNYHSKLPLISGRTGTQAGIANSLGTLTAAIATARVSRRACRSMRRSRSPRTPAQCRGRERRRPVARDCGRLCDDRGQHCARRRQRRRRRRRRSPHTNMRRRRSYFTEYPEDIQLFGVSFNTQLGTTGVALQGEVSYRKDVPLQFDDVELLFAALTPFEAAALAAQGIPMPATCTPALPTLSRCGSSAPTAPTRW